MTISRRTFFSVLGAGATVGLAAACSGDPAAGPTSTSPVAGSTTSAPPPSTPSGPPDWAALRARVSGGLLLPGDSGYDVAKRGFNPLFDGHKPAAVAKCAKPEDVQACIEAARGRGVPIAARSGGHSYVGYSTPDGGLVVDLRGMSGVQVQPDGSAVVGAGARLIDVYAGLADSGRLLPAGSCPTVGIGGLTLGGGIGVLSRKYGLTCDRLTSAQVVTADGRLITASEESEPDLFWALRGGGGGNFGIVTSFTFRTEAAPQLTVFQLRFAGGATADVLGGWQEWLPGAPAEVWSNCVISGGATPTSRIGGCFVGSPGGLNPLLDRLIGKIGSQPSSRSVQAKGFLDAMKYMAGCSSRSTTQCHPDFEGGQLQREAFVASSRILDGPADPAAVVKLMAGRSGMDLLLDSLGGEVSTVESSATAFPHRTALASAQIYVGTSSSEQQRSTTSLAEVRDGLGAIAGPHGYVNYIDPDLKDWGSAYYGANLGRLKDVAKHYDPDGVFAFAQSVAKG